MGFDAVLRDAPALVVASAPRAASNGMVDVTLALSYFELAAPTLGLGTCWAGLLEGALLSSSAARKALGLPEGHPLSLSHDGRVPQGEILPAARA